MKRLTVIILSFLIATMTAMAGKVTESEALRKAQQFLKGKSFTSATDYRQQARGTSAPVTLFLSPFYVFNAMEGGYVIISGDDRTREVLGYSATGTLDMDNLPENLQWWLEEYARQMEAIEKGVAVAAPAHRRSPMVTIAPLVQTRWSQGKPYNLMCPDGSGRDYDEDGYDPDDRCITGCAATALAQVMNYWQWPKESPALDSYMTVDFEVKELPATTFNWGKMKNSYQSDETGEEAYAVSELMRYCGQVMYMDYGTDASGSSSSFRNALVDVFNYSQNTQRLYRDDYTTDVWEGIVYEELAERRPVLYGGASSAAGHAFVIDGYDGNGLFHFNWGWGGSYDDYFVLSIADPYHPGLDASDDGNGYSSGQEAVIGAQPFRGDETQPYAVLSNDGQTVTFYYDGLMAERHGVGIVSYRVEESPYVTASKAVIDASMANYHPYSTAFWFYECKNLKTIEGINNIKTDEVRDMSWMFHGCTSLTSLDVSKFNTDNVTSMNRTFANCSSLTSLDVSKFKTDNVVDMYCMFYGCSGLTKLNLGSIKTDNAKALGWMFAGCSNLKSLNVKNFNTDNVTDLTAMFYGCSSLTSLDVSGFNTGNVTNMSWMFYGCSGLTSLDVSKFKTDKVTDMSVMFYNCSSLTSLDVSKFTTDNVTDMSWMFNGCSSLKKLDVSGFQTEKVTNMLNMFNGCSSLKSLDVSGFHTDNVTAMNAMFANCSGLTSLDVSGFHTSNVTNMNWMFGGCSGLTSLDVSGFQTSNVEDMNWMFANCSSLKKLDVSGFRTDNVTNMSVMFYNCSGLTSLDVSGFFTDNVTDMSWMFGACTSLATIYASEAWSTAQVEKSEYMFYGCQTLKGGNGTAYDDYHLDAEYACVDGGAGSPGYFTYKTYDHVDAYVALSDDGKTATFYYDKNKIQRGGKPITNSKTKTAYGTAETIAFDTTFADFQPTSTAYWFLNCTALTTIRDIRNLSTDHVTNMHGMFAGCSSLKKLDVSSLKTENVTDMGNMFAGCSRLKRLNLSNFKTDNVIAMDSMFTDCSNLLTIYVNDTNWSTASVSSSYQMFHQCTRLVGGRGTTYSRYNTNAIFACVDKADTAGYLTALYSGEEPVGDAEPYAVLSSNNTVLTFYYDDKRNRRGGMDVFPFRYGSNGKTNAGWFAQAGDITTVTFDASMANCTSLTSTAFWFYMCNQLKTINGIANLRTDNVTRMDYMFYNDSQLANLDVSGFNTGNVTDMNAMFGYCSKLNSIVLGSTFVSSNANKIDYVFTGNDELKSVTFTGDIPSTINDRFFVNVGTRESPVRLIVPEQYKANYAAMFFGDLFFGGYLTLEDTSGIHAEISDNQPYDIYSLDGRLVRKGATSLKSLPKGVYIVHGRKVVVQ